MPTYKAPDVYVQEVSVLPPSVAEVETAIPAFIGYTKIAERYKEEDLRFVPTKIRSLKEFEWYFGGPDLVDINVTVKEDKVTGSGVFAYADDPNPSVKFFLYYSIQLFFENGGGQCYIVSVGGYGKAVDVNDLKKGLEAVALEDEPTLLVIPEAVKLKDADFGSLSEAQLKQCEDLGDRFAIFDIPCDLNSKGLTPKELEDKRKLFGMNYLKHAAAYYPYLRTALPFVIADEKKVKVTLPNAAPPPQGQAPAQQGQAAAAQTLADLATTDAANYNLVKLELRSCRITLPPSGAVAGAYAATDSTRGVWKAPANISLASVIAPVVKLDSKLQADYNIDTTSGKSINVIRSFAGKGTLIWGARTLAGNDNEWRYVPVRRFFTMVEESTKKSTYWAVFEPNDANTWVKVRGMIENYLTQKWREGALAGATPKDAFFVRCGLGITMDAQDILEGRLIVEIGMAVVRPAEFIILRFMHKLQTS